MLNEDHTDVPPDEARSGKGTLAKFTAPDETTLVMTFDAPAPLTADRLAMWVNGTVGNGPKWMAPRHYAEQFHPKYNKSVPKNWAEQGELFELKVDWSRNPDCPTMTGWRLKSLREGQSIVYERNPFYYAVTARTATSCPTSTSSTSRSCRTPRSASCRPSRASSTTSWGSSRTSCSTTCPASSAPRPSSGMTTLLWDGGSGTSSMFFLNYDHKDEKYRKLIREPKFRQALSLGVNRADIQKAAVLQHRRADHRHPEPEGEGIPRRRRRQGHLQAVARLLRQARPREAPRPCSTSSASSTRTATVSANTLTAPSSRSASTSRPTPPPEHKSKNQALVSGLEGDRDQGHAEPRLPRGVLRRLEGR